MALEKEKQPVKPKRDPINRLLGYGEEVASYFRRRRIKRSPRVLIRWSDGTAKSVDPESSEGRSIMDLADQLIGIAEDASE